MIPDSEQFATISKLREWKQAQIRLAEEKALTMEERLRSAVPHDLRQAIENKHIIQDLIDYGGVWIKFRSDEGECYGFTQFKEFIERFNRLKTAWQEFAEVDILDSDPDSDYFEIAITAL